MSEAKKTYHAVTSANGRGLVFEADPRRPKLWRLIDTLLTIELAQAKAAKLTRAARNGPVTLRTCATERTLISVLRALQRQGLAHAGINIIAHRAGCTPQTALRYLPRLAKSSLTVQLGNGNWSTTGTAPADLLPRGAA